MSTYPFPGSGGWRTNLTRGKVGLTPDIPFLASQRYTVKRGGATFKQVTASTSPTNEVQTLAASSATAGTFTLTYGGQTTSALAYTATAAQIQAALQALSSIGLNNLTATGGPANTTNVVLTFTGDLAGQNAALITINKASLTGGSAAAITETTRGQGAGTVEIRKGTFVLPDPANAGFYKAYASGDTIITDGSVGPSGFLMESINVADGNVSEGVLIQGSVIALRVQPQPIPAAIQTACAGRIVFQ